MKISVPKPEAEVTPANEDAEAKVIIAKIDNEGASTPEVPSEPKAEETAPVKELKGTVKAVLRGNVRHNGKTYEKGTEIKDKALIELFGKYKLI